MAELQSERDDLRAKLQNSNAREDRERKQPRTLEPSTLDLVPLGVLSLVFPPGRGTLVHDLATRIGPVPIGAEVPRALRQQRCLPMNVPLIWTASGSEETHPVLQWLVSATSAIEEPIEFYEGGIVASDAVALGGTL